MRRGRRLPPYGGALPRQRRDGGFAVEGPGFYVWDEDLGEAVGVAREISGGGAFRVGRGTRLKLLPEDEPGPVRD